MADLNAEGGVFSIPAGQYDITGSGEPGPESEVPLLYGDGIHDDAPALNAGISGKPVRCAWCLELIDFTLSALPPRCPSKHLSQRTEG
jgi:hypothetical protein